MTPADLYVISGNQGAGKSTVGRLLAQRFPVGRSVGWCRDSRSNATEGGFGRSRAKSISTVRSRSGKGGSGYEPLSPADTRASGINAVALTSAPTLQWQKHESTLGRLGRRS